MGWTIVLSTCKSITTSAVRVSGTIRFHGDAPTHIPDGSHLHVTLQDANVMDTDATHLGRFTHRIKDYNHADGIRYEIKDAERPVHGPKASLSAILNVGWSPDDEGSDEWIRSGDYINDVHHDVHVHDDVDEYEKMIDVVQI